MEHIAAKLAAFTLTGCLTLGAQAHAVAFNDLFVFGDSYSDTGAYVPLTNGSTAVGYLAQSLGITLTTSKNPSPGTNGVNFAQSGARVDVTPANGAQPLSLTQQVAAFQSYVSSSAVTFNPATSLFFLLGGLNDHTRATQAEVSLATAKQVATLYGLGARYFEIALLPSLVPAFTDSATNLNPGYTALVPQLQAQYPDARIGLSNWGTYYDDILRNPGQYGITNTTDRCQGNAACTNPDTYFYYVSAHPSDISHRIVGQKIYAEALAIQDVPEPMSIVLLSTGLAGLVAVRRHRRA